MREPKITDKKYRNPRNSLHPYNMAWWQHDLLEWERCESARRQDQQRRDDARQQEQQSAAAAKAQQQRQKAAEHAKWQAQKDAAVAKQHQKDAAKAAERAEWQAGKDAALAREAANKTTRLSISREHTSKSNDGKQHVDSYRNTSDSKRTDKTGHNDYPGEQHINVRKGK